MLGTAWKGGRADAQVVHGYCPFCSLLYGHCEVNEALILMFSPKGGSEVTLQDDASWINGDGVERESGRTLCPDQKYR